MIAILDHYRCEQRERFMKGALSPLRGGQPTDRLPRNFAQFRTECNSGQLQADTQTHSLPDRTASETPEVDTMLICPSQYALTMSLGKDLNLIPGSLAQQQDVRTQWHSAAE